MITDKQGNSDPGTEGRGRFGKGAIALIVLAGVMGLTNPARDEYLNYASDKLASELKISFCKESKMREFLGDVGGALVGTCKTLVASQRDTMERLIDNSTQRQNLLIFSIYTTEVGGHRYHSIGAFGNFLTIPAK